VVNLIIIAAVFIDLCKFFLFFRFSALIVDGDIANTVWMRWGYNLVLG